MFRHLVLGLAALSLVSCAGSSQVGGAPNLQVVEGNALPSPGRFDLTKASRPYLVGPFDKLTIDVFGIPEMQQRDIAVDAGGRISFPLAGNLDVAGKTPDEVATLLRDRLKERFVRDPQVTVNLKEAVSQVVTVDGEVRKPGQYPVIGRMTLLRAIAISEGTSEFSNLDHVVVFRQVEGRDLAALYSLRMIRQGAYADPEIFGNDVVVVGDSRARRIFKDFLGIVPLLTTPLIVALQ
ncbi:polysaccharide biosynthesis/export family protein [Sphingomonas sp.]|uniref:polysaccharide biosynthesis/export family protein n=1 Tax=Sphingomonas sp. TaxID=28214 RepID=UPI002DD620E3|nr:polysaccharide biosynthesis/export family protein [Sphingomonas sp.]